MQEFFSIICKEPMSILIIPEQEAFKKVLVIDTVSILPPFSII
ncbi:unnamed protein product, partial [Musa hybrid cultivar]